MHLKVEQSSSNKYVFSLVSNDEEVYRSDNPVLPFLGEYGDYQTRKDALVASTQFAYRNFHTLTCFADQEDYLDSDGIRARAVAKFSRGLDTFLEMLDAIKKSKEKGDLKQRVQSIKTMVDQYAKAMLEVAKEFENDARVDNIPDDVNIHEIPESELKSQQARDLLSLKSKLHLFYRDLRSNFDKYVDVVASGIMRKMLFSESVPWYKDILVEYGNGIASSLDLNGIELSSIVDTDNGHDMKFKTANGDFTVSLSKDLIVNGIHPHDGLINHFPPMSQSYYNSLWFPIFKEVGNFRIDDYVVAVPKRASKNRKIGHSEGGEYLKDSFVAFDVRDGKETVVDVYLNGDTGSCGRTCAFTMAGDKNREQTINDLLNGDVERLSAAKMVRCIGTGTKYDGMAGEVQHSGIVRRETYIEVPVMFKFDNGMEEVVVLKNDNLEVYA